MSNNLKVKWNEWDPNRMPKTNLEHKTITPKPDPNKPGETPLQIKEQNLSFAYKYPIKDNNGHPIEVVGDFYIEFPKITAPDGIKTEPGKGSSILCHFDQTRPDIQQFISTDPNNPGFCHTFRNLVLERLFENRGHISSISNAESVVEIRGSLKSLLYTVTDPNTNQPVPGKNPTKYFKLLDFGQPGTFNRRESQFTEPTIDPETGKPKVIPWELLRGVKMDIIPLIRFKVTHRSKIILEAMMVSAVVVSIEKAGSSNLQLDTCNQISQDKVIMESLERQLKNLRMAKESDKKTQTSDTQKTNVPSNPTTQTNVPQLSAPPSVVQNNNPQPNVTQNYQQNFPPLPAQSIPVNPIITNIPGIVPGSIPNLSAIMAAGPNIINNNK
jgi:hypothetical protein